MPKLWAGNQAGILTQSIRTDVVGMRLNNQLSFSRITFPCFSCLPLTVIWPQSNCLSITLKKWTCTVFIPFFIGYMWVDCCMMWKMTASRSLSVAYTSLWVICWKAAVSVVFVVANFQSVLQLAVYVTSWMCSGDRAPFLSITVANVCLEMEFAGVWSFCHQKQKTNQSGFYPWNLFPYFCDFLFFILVVSKHTEATAVTRFVHSYCTYRCPSCLMKGKWKRHLFSQCQCHSWAQ